MNPDSDYQSQLCSASDGRVIIAGCESWILVSLVASHVCLRLCLPPVGPWSFVAAPS